MALISPISKIISKQNYTLPEQKLIIKNNWYWFSVPMSENYWFLLGKKIGNSPVLLFIKRRVFPSCNIMYTFLWKKTFLE